MGKVKTDKGNSSVREHRSTRYSLGSGEPPVKGAEGLVGLCWGQLGRGSADMVRLSNTQ